MRHRFFTIPIYDGVEAAAELNRCLAEARVLAVDRQFVADGANSAWAVCVALHERGKRPASVGRRVGKIDYKEVLTADDFALFARLRELRKQLAERDGVPSYAVFTNEQLASIVQGRVTSAHGSQSHRRHRRGPGREICGPGAGDHDGGERFRRNG